MTVSAAIFLLERLTDVLAAVHLVRLSGKVVARISKPFFPGVATHAPKRINGLKPAIDNIIAR